MEDGNDVRSQLPVSPALGGAGDQGSQGLQVREWPALFISDVHLGTKYCQPRRLADFLEKNTSKVLYLVGDVIDEWARSHVEYWRWSLACDDVIDIIRGYDRVVYLYGNHDPNGVALSLLPNVEVRLSIDHTTSSKKTYLVTHGHTHDVTAVPMHILQTFGLLKLANPRVDGKSHHVFRWFDDRVKRRLLREVKTRLIQKYDGVVCGHTHVPACKSDFPEYYNCGDWISSCTAVAETKSGDLILIGD